MLHQHDGNNQTSLIAIKADSQSSLVAPADVSLSGIAEGIELQLAATGSREAIRRYLDRQLAQFGRQVELHSADTISCEAGHRRVALLASEHRLINGSCPGGPGSVDEMVGVLRVMAADVSQSASPSDGMPMLVQRDRRLVEYTLASARRMSRSLPSRPGRCSPGTSGWRMRVPGPTSARMPT